MEPLKVIVKAVLTSEATFLDECTQNTKQRTDVRCLASVEYLLRTERALGQSFHTGHVIPGTRLFYGQLSRHVYAAPLLHGYRYTHWGEDTFISIYQPSGQPCAKIKYERLRYECAGTVFPFFSLVFVRARSWRSFSTRTR